MSQMDPKKAKDGGKDDLEKKLKGLSIQPKKDTQEHVLSRFNLQELLSIPSIGPYLEGTTVVNLVDEKSFATIPKKGGVYFIVTNEPVNHSFHNNQFPKGLPEGFQVVYNGTADNLADRAKKHLLRSLNKGMSGISVDVLTTGEAVVSHTKCLFSPNTKNKTPFVNGKRVTSVKDLTPMQMSEKERSYIDTHGDKTVYLQNGIHVLSEKHKRYKWRFHYVLIESHSVRDIVETHWRKEHGIPRLCTYAVGR